MGSESAGDPFPGGSCCPEQQPARSHTRRPPKSTPSPHKATPPASPSAAPRLPTSAVFSPPSLPPGSERSRAFAHNHCFLVHARALSVLILTHFWTFRIFFYVCSSSIKYTTSHGIRGLLSSFVVTTSSPTHSSVARIVLFITRPLFAPEVSRCASVIPLHHEDRLCCAESSPDNDSWRLALTLPGDGFDRLFGSNDTQWTPSDAMTWS